MEFSTDAQREIYDKITPWMTELFGVFVKKREDGPYWGLHMGSAYIIIGVYAWGDDDATISVRSYVVTKVEIVPDLLLYLMRENDAMRFGAFGLDKDNDIFLEHTIVGSTCDKEELKASVLAIAYRSDEYDDKIVQRWGGQRAEDRK